MMEQQGVLSTVAASTTTTTNDSGSEQSTEQQTEDTDILDSSKFDLQLDKSNILMLGPTGSGITGISLYVRLSVCLSVTTSH